MAAGATLALLLTSPAAGAYTGTPAAVKLVREMRAAYRSIRAVEDVASGALVYCPSVPEGWTFAPHVGCAVRARVSEEDDLSGGRVVRIVGSVSAPAQPTLRYVVSAQGWYQAAAGANCWRSFALPFSQFPYVSFPFPNARLAVIRRTRNAVVLQATTPRIGYRDLEYVNPRTHLQTGGVEITYLKHKSYRVVDHISVLRHPTQHMPTPICGP